MYVRAAEKTGDFSISGCIPRPDIHAPSVSLAAMQAGNKSTRTVATSQTLKKQLDIAPKMRVRARTLSFQMASFNRAVALRLTTYSISCIANCASNN